MLQHSKSALAVHNLVRGRAASGAGVVVGPSGSNTAPEETDTTPEETPSDPPATPETDTMPSNPPAPPETDTTPSDPPAPPETPGTQEEARDSSQKVRPVWIPHSQLLLFLIRRKPTPTIILLFY